LLPTLLVISGPTAIGKTALAIRLAQTLGSEIISADSRQFFREMSIGTAKPSEAELRAAPHHFINNLSISDEYDAGKFEAEALSLTHKLFKQQDVVIVCGGSGMYIDALCKGFDPLPEVDAVFREKLSALYRTEGISALQKLLLEKDPDYYERIDLQNPHRLIRALEITLSTGRPYSSFRKGIGKHRDFRILRFALNTERKMLYERIDHRVERMMKAGLEEEARKLLAHRNRNALQTVGYKELFEYFDKKIDLAQAIEQIKQNTRRFAKRQLTWFRKDPDTIWLEAADLDILPASIIRSLKEG
jgi:tRNA dimethylallyltransferase